MSTKLLRAWICKSSSIARRGNGEQSLGEPGQLRLWLVGSVQRFPAWGKTDVCDSVQVK